MYCSLLTKSLAGTSCTPLYFTIYFIIFLTHEKTAVLQRVIQTRGDFRTLQGQEELIRSYSCLSDNPSLYNYTLFNASLHGPSLVHFSEPSAQLVLQVTAAGCYVTSQPASKNTLPCWSYETKLRLYIIISKKLRINGQESISHIDFKQQTYAFTCSNSTQRHPQFQTTVTSL